MLPALTPARRCGNGKPQKQGKDSDPANNARGSPIRQDSGGFSHTPENPPSLSEPNSASKPNQPFRHTYYCACVTPSLAVLHGPGQKKKRYCLAHSLWRRRGRRHLRAAPAQYSTALSLPSPSAYLPPFIVCRRSGNAVTKPLSSSTQMCY